MNPESRIPNRFALGTEVTSLSERTILTEGNPESLRSRDEHRTEPPDAG